MNCCDDYGNCTQGRDCPIRTGIITPEQRAYMNAKMSVEFAEPEFTRFETLMGALAQLVGVLAAVILIAGTVGYVWVRWV